MIDAFIEDYEGAHDATYYSKLADYKDTIEELIEIERTGNYDEPLPLVDREGFYSNIKVKGNTDVINMKFKSGTTSKSDESFIILTWVLY